MSRMDDLLDEERGRLYEENARLKAELDQVQPILAAAQIAAECERVLRGEVAGDVNDAMTRRTEAFAAITGGVMTTRYSNYPDHPLVDVPQAVLDAARAALQEAHESGDVAADMVAPIADSVVLNLLPWLSWPV